jgi:hypothetical protein
MGTCSFSHWNIFKFRLNSSSIQFFILKSGMSGVFVECLDLWHISVFLRSLQSPWTACKYSLLLGHKNYIERLCSFWLIDRNREILLVGTSAAWLVLGIGRNFENKRFAFTIASWDSSHFHVRSLSLNIWTDDWCARLFSVLHSFWVKRGGSTLFSCREKYFLLKKSRIVIYGWISNFFCKVINDKVFLLEFFISTKSDQK